MAKATGTERPALKKTGIEGLDDVLGGGLAANRSYLLEGSPGTGKTTIALQFLMEGRAAGERCLYITLSETEEELRDAAASHGWSLDGIDIFELLPPESLLDAEQRQFRVAMLLAEEGTTTEVLLWLDDEFRVVRSEAEAAGFDGVTEYDYDAPVEIPDVG